mmetsp:Transcript_104730/g.312841  ORF Transcript_104730/g.312841 Transcript_104730/m.312841 type:complete len:355 (+) Transcript_104730:47-1111(+)
MSAWLQSLAAAASGRASARRFWRVARAGFPVIQPAPLEPAQVRNSYSSDFLYVLATDEVRMAAFRRAIARRRARQVLEVGCGPWTPLVEMALASGAEQVVAVEASPEHAREARRRLASELRRGRVLVLDGRVGEGRDGAAAFPEGPRPDVLVAELLGYTASEEGAPAVFAALQRRFGPLPTIPRAARSFMAPVRPLALSARDRWRNWLVHGSWPRPERLVPGRLYDCRGIPRSLELAAPQPWESFDFARPDALAGQLLQRRRLRFPIPAGAEVGGLLLWMQADLDEEIGIDTREEETSWNHYYLHLPRRGTVQGGYLTVDVNVDARSENTAYQFSVGGVTYSSHGGSAPSCVAA